VARTCGTQELDGRLGLNQLTTANDAHARHLRLVDLRNMGETIFLELGRELFEFERDKCYQVLGYASFNSYLADPDIDISPRTAYRLKSVYKKYILDLALPPATLVGAGYTKLSMISSQVDEDNVDAWLVKAGTLSRADIIKELKDNDANYQEPPLIRLLDVMQLSYSLSRETMTIETLTNVKYVQQGNYVTVTGNLVQNRER